MMKRVISLFALIALLSVPVLVQAAVSKQGSASASVTSGAATSNSIPIRVNNRGKIRKNQLFGAATSVSGTATAAGALDGNEPARLTVTGAGAGAASASGKNRGRANKVWLPKVGGTTNSVNAVAAQVDLWID